MAKRGIGLGMHPFGLENVKSSDGGILQPGKGVYWHTKININNTPRDLEGLRMANVDRMVIYGH